MKGRVLWRRVAEDTSIARQTFLLVWRASPRRLLFLCALTLLSALLPICMAWVGKLIIDTIVQSQGGVLEVERDRSLGRLLNLVLIEFAFAACFLFVERTTVFIKQGLGTRLALRLTMQILEKAQGFTLAQLEDPTIHDKLVRARREASSRPLSLMLGNLQVLRGAIILLGYSGLLLRFSPLAVVGILVAAVPSLISEVLFSNVEYVLRKSRSSENRKITYIEHVLGDSRHVKELRVFMLGSELLNRYKRLTESLHRDEESIVFRRTFWSFALSIISSAAYYGCYIYIALSAANGHLSLGDMVLYGTAFRSSQAAFSSLLGALGNMYEANLYMSNLFEYFSIETTDREVRSTVIGPEETGIRFDRVSFKYADSNAWAIHNLSLFIPSGQSLAVVGGNGAGKTTFIKLLTRLYEPTEGRIFIDGLEIRSWRLAALTKRMAVLFQDFNHYQLTFQENVGFGSIEHLVDDSRLERAIEHGGAKELLTSLPQGKYSTLGRRFENGTELSGGQWQSVALARAFMREEADILILDEPTAALDAKAEFDIMERFKHLSSGRTSIIVSHRFPTARLANRIIVLDRGEIIEDGTHESLVERGGKYAGLFALQSRGFK